MENNLSLVVTGSDEVDTINQAFNSLVSSYAIDNTGETVPDGAEESTPSSVCFEMRAYSLSDFGNSMLPATGSCKILVSGVDRLSSEYQKIYRLKGYLLSSTISSDLDLLLRSIEGMNFDLGAQVNILFDDGRGIGVVENISGQEFHLLDEDMPEFAAFASREKPPLPPILKRLLLEAQSNKTIEVAEAANGKK